VIGEAFHHPGPALVEAMVDPNEPPLPGKITTDQAWQFAKALAKGQKDRWDIIKTIVENKIREVV
jgi:pyruvate dehydrogenase (quinone)